MAGRYWYISLSDESKADMVGANQSHLQLINASLYPSTFIKAQIQLHKVVEN